MRITTRRTRTATAVPTGTRPEHAVVIGASMAGLTVAKALTERFDRVTLVERDHLPTGPEHRRGVPQDRHIHLLLPAGIDALEQLFKGLLEELRADGATITETDRIRMCLNGHRLASARSGRPAVLASRPFLEAHVRRRVREEPQIRVREGARVSGLAASDDRRRVEGVELGSANGGTPRILSADLVVDCSGRRSPLPSWLGELGYHAPEADELDVQVRYTTRRYELPNDVLDGDRHVLVGPTPKGPRGGAMTNVEDGSWIVTLFAMGGVRAPTDDRSFERFAAELPIGDIHGAIGTGRALDEPAPYRFPTNRWNRYDRLDGLPAGLLVAGDAVCSFNPIYGQGMSVAAMEAQALQTQLREGTYPPARDWFRQTAGLIDTAWKLAVGSDLAVEAVQGTRPVSVRVMNRYLARLQATAVTDPHLTAQLIRVLGLVDPPTRLLRPGTVTRVACGVRAEG